MNTIVHIKLKRGFTLSEVMLAVGIVAFGLVAVFSILPFGLTAQKDNREETIIRYEAEYWFAVLQAGGMKLESMDRVETIELKDAVGSVYRVNRYDLSAAGKEDWSADVCGWLSAPDYIWNNGSKTDRVPAKYARVWAVNGSLFDRLYSDRNQSGHYLDGGEFSFSYFLETKVEPIINSGSRITLTFHWPITEPVENALSPKSPANPNGGRSIGSIVNPDNPLYDEEKLRPPPNEKEFSILTNLRPRPALSDANLNPRQRRVMKAGFLGVTSIKELKDDLFPDKKSWDPWWDGFERKLKVTGQPQMINQVGIVARNSVDGLWQEFSAWNPAAGDLRMMLNNPDDLGWYLQVLNPNTKVREFYASMIGIHPLDINNKKPIHDFAFLGGAILPKYLNRYFDFKISFLKPGETWEDLLAQYQRQGLGRLFVDPDTGEYKWEFGSTYNSIHDSTYIATDGSTKHYKFFKIIELNGVGVPNPQPARFSLTLEPDDYYPFEAPLGSTRCSFWFLR